MNKVLLTGNLTREIEVKKTATGKSVAQFSLAVNDFGKTDFIDCRAWEKAADNLAAFTKKGQKILIEGRIKSETYEKEGNKVKKVLVEVANFEFLTPKEKEEREEKTNYNVNIDPEDLPFY